MLTAIGIIFMKCSADELITILMLYKPHIFKKNAYLVYATS